MEFGWNGESVGEAISKLRKHLCDTENKFIIGISNRTAVYEQQREFAVLVASISYTLENCVIYTIENEVKVSIECLYHTSDSKSYACIDVRIMGKSISMEHVKGTWITKEDLVGFVDCTIKEYIKNTTPFKEIGSLYHQKGLLGDGIRRIALEMGIIHKDAMPNGPELLMLVDNIIENNSLIKLHRDLMSAVVINIAMELGITNKDTGPSESDISTLVDDILKTIRKEKG